MKSLRIPAAATVKTATFLEVMDYPFNASSDLVGLIPLIGITDRSGIHTEATLRIDIDHAPGL